MQQKQSGSHKEEELEQGYSLTCTKWQELRLLSPDTDNGGVVLVKSPPFCPSAEASMKGEPDKTFREVAMADPLERPQHIKDVWRVR